MVESITFLEAGYCKQFEKFVNPISGAWKEIRFSNSVAVIQHPRHGVTLLDTGYSPRFYDQTKYFPERIYSYLTKVKVEPEDTALYQLTRMGISQKDIRQVVLSHFHGDHIAGAADFTKAKYLYSSNELQYLRSLSRINQVRYAYIDALVPTDLEQRKFTLSEKWVPIPELNEKTGDNWLGQDLFGDESVIAVPLPGHSFGHTGLFIRKQSGPAYFLISDASWLKDSIEKNIHPGILPRLVFHDPLAYDRTLDRVHAVYASDPKKERIRIVPCHCHQLLKDEGMR